MERRQKSLRVTLKPLFLYYDDLVEIIHCLKEVSSEISINTEEYSLSDIKEIKEKEYAKQSRDWHEQVRVQENLSKDFLRQKGMKFITLSPIELARWKQAVQPVEAILIKKLNDLGLQGQKAVDEAKASVAHK